MGTATTVTGKFGCALMSVWRMEHEATDAATCRDIKMHTNAGMVVGGRCAETEAGEMSLMESFATVTLGTVHSFAVI